MLLKKKVLYLIFWLKKRQNIKVILNSVVFYVGLKKPELFLINSMLLVFLLKKKVVCFYFYFFNLKVVSKVLLNNILLSFFDSLKKINLKLVFKLNKIKTVKKSYTVLRSPFVYKKSREEFLIEKHNAFFLLILGVKSIFKSVFLQNFLEKLVVLSNSVNFVVVKFILIR